MDLLELLRAPYFIGLLLAMGFLGWLMAGNAGAVIGAGVGAVIGLIFDFAEHPLVERWRLPVTVAMIAALYLGFTVWGA